MRGHPDHPQPNARVYAGLLLGLLGLLLAGVAAINWVVDPLQVFRRSTWHPPHFSENQRYQVPGLARHYAQPVIVLGTSHMENMLPGLLAASLGQPALNLAIAGSSLREQRLALDLALAGGEVRRVLWGIDYSALTWGDILVEEWGEFPDYLYDRDLRLVSRYLLSLQTLWDGAAALRGESAITLENRNTWWNRHTFSGDRVLAAWRQQGQELTPAARRSMDAKLSWPVFREVLARRLFAPIQNHPEIRFDLILPPYSLLNYANDFRLHDEYFFQRLLMREALREFAAGHANVALWDFQTDAEVVGDLGNYKDLEHYGLAINRRMLARIAMDHPDTTAGKAFPGLVRDYLRGLCAEGGDLCPASVRCGLDRLTRWLDAGADPTQALEAARSPCG